MKVLVQSVIGALASLVVSGCSTTLSGLNSTASVTAKIAANSQTACLDLSGIGFQVGTIIAQVAAANPNNATIQKASAKVASGTALANADCAVAAALAGLVNVTASAVRK